MRNIGETGLIWFYQMAFEGSANVLQTARTLGARAAAAGCTLRAHATGWEWRTTAAVATAASLCGGTGAGRLSLCSDVASVRFCLCRAT